LSSIFVVLIHQIGLCHSHRSKMRFLNKKIRRKFREFSRCERNSYVCICDVDSYIKKHLELSLHCGCEHETRNNCYCYYCKKFVNYMWPKVIFLWKPGHTHSKIFTIFYEFLKLGKNSRIFLRILKQKVMQILNLWS